MNTEAHLAAGWVLAHCAPNTTRKFRGLITLAAVIPDIDALTYIGGERAYACCHHAWGHNVFFNFLVSLGCTYLLRGRRLEAFVLSQLAFYSHYFGDYYFTRFPIQFFWPISTHGYIHSYRIGLDHPINIFLSYFSFVLMIAMAFVWKRTPIELVSPELDKRVVNLFRKKTLACHVCGKAANEHCAHCGQASCRWHSRITRRFQICCSGCASAVAIESPK